MRVAVTGAAGHLGSHLCARLAALAERDLIRIDLRDLPNGAGQERQWTCPRRGRPVRPWTGLKS